MSHCPTYVKKIRNLVYLIASIKIQRKQISILKKERVFRDVLLISHVFSVYVLYSLLQEEVQSGF